MALEGARGRRERLPALRDAGVEPCSRSGDAATAGRGRARRARVRAAGGPPRRRAAGHVRRHHRAAPARRQQLARREAQLAQAQEMTHLGSWEWDLRTNAGSSGRRSCTGSTACARASSAARWRRSWSACTRTCARRSAPRSQAAIAEGRPFAFEERVLRPDGSERHAVLARDGRRDRRRRRAGPRRRRVPGHHRRAPSRRPARGLQARRRARSLDPDPAGPRGPADPARRRRARRRARAPAGASGCSERIRATRARAVVVDLTGVPRSSRPSRPRSCTRSSPPA